MGPHVCTGGLASKSSEQFVGANFSALEIPGQGSGTVWFQ